MVFETVSHEKVLIMKGSIIVLLCFVAGWTAGNLAGMIDGMHSLSVWLLYLLMFQVGLGIGSNPDLGKMLRSLRMMDILLPVATMAGTLLFTAAGSFLISRWSMAECLAVNSACGYYSLSSILVSQLKGPTLGVALATQLGTVALLANIFRELAALIGAPLICRFLGPESEISAAGVTSVDVCLPAIRKWCGPSYVPSAIIHGVLIDISTPFFISFFCSL